MTAHEAPIQPHKPRSREPVGTDSPFHNHVPPKGGGDSTLSAATARLASESHLRLEKGIKQRERT